MHCVIRVGDGCEVITLSVVVDYFFLQYQTAERSVRIVALDDSDHKIIPAFIEVGDNTTTILDASGSIPYNLPGTDCRWMESDTLLCDSPIVGIDGVVVKVDGPIINVGTLSNRLQLDFQFSTAHPNALVLEDAQLKQSLTYFPGLYASTSKANTHQAKLAIDLYLFGPH